MPLPASESPGMRAGLLRPAALRGGLCGAGRHRQALHRRSFGLGHSLGYPFSLSSGPITTARYTVLEDEYELGEELGAGRFGTVYMATDRKTGEKYAVKSITKSAVTANGMTPGMLRNEVDVLRKLTERGPHERTGRGLLTELTAVHEDPTYVWLVSPLYEGGELFDRIVALSAQGRPYTEVQAALIFEQLLSALDNCLQNGKKAPSCAKDPIAQLKIVLVDFGVAKSFAPGQDLSATEMAGSLP